MELSWTTTVLLWTFVTLISWYIISAVWHYSLFYRLGIPGPQPLPVLGTFGQFVYHGWSKFQVSTYQRYKGHKVYGIYDGSQPMIVLRDLDMIKDVCVKHFSSFVNRRVFALQPPADHMLNMLKDDHWKNVRSRMSPAFSSGKVKRMYPCVAMSVTNLIKKMQDNADQGEPLELKDVISRYTSDVIAGTGFGVLVNSHQEEKNKVKDAINAMLKMSGLVVIFTFLCPWLVSICNFLGVRLYRAEHSQFFQSFINELLEERKQEQAEGHASRRNDFLQLMLEAQDDGSDQNNDNMSKEEALALRQSATRKPLTNLDYQGSALIYYLAGFDTVSGVLSFALFILALNPEICAKVQDEIDDILGGKPLPDFENTAELTYLDRCVQETVRMFPPGVLLDRMCNKEIEIQGIKIPEGVGVQFPVYALHHDPDLFPNPEIFDPDRFSPENKADRHPFAQMLFGQGPRNCIGQRLAQLEVKVALAGVLRHLTPVVCDKTVYPVKLDKMIFKAVDGLWVKMEKRL